jgi:hypothetical protein
MAISPGAVDDLKKTLRAFEELGVEPEHASVELLESAPMICFVRDPDGYVVELVGVL